MRGHKRIKLRPMDGRLEFEMIKLTKFAELLTVLNQDTGVMDTFTKAELSSALVKAKVRGATGVEIHEHSLADLHLEGLGGVAELVRMEESPEDGAVFMLNNLTGLRYFVPRATLEAHPRLARVLAA